MKILSISAKCSDCFTADLTDTDHGGKFIGEYRGYVPEFFPENHYGDYIKFEIDIDTGRILNWKKPEEEDLEIFKNKEEEIDGN